MMPPPPLCHRCPLHTIEGKILSLSIFANVLRAREGTAVTTPSVGTWPLHWQPSAIEIIAENSFGATLLQTY